MFSIDELLGPPPAGSAELPNSIVHRKLLDESVDENDYYICYEKGWEEEMVRLKCQCPYWLHESCLAQALLEIGGCPLFRTPTYKIDDEQILGSAAEKGDVPKVTELLKSGTQPSPRLLHDITPLMLAGKEGRTGVVYLLLAHGASMLEQDSFRKTTFHGAMSNGHVGVIQELLSQGANSQTIDINKNTLLHIAVRNRSLELMTLTLDHGVPIGAKER